jgi:hypothetical protein
VRTLTGWLFVGIGALALLAAVMSVLTETQFVARAAWAPGVVEHLNAGGSHPEIAFVTKAGARISYPQGGFIFGYSPGRKVQVLYDPADPSNTAVVNDPGALWDFPVLAVMFAVGFAGSGLFTVRAGSRLGDGLR